MPIDLPHDVILRPYAEDDLEQVIDLKWQMNLADIAASRSVGHPSAEDTDPTREAALQTVSRQIEKAAQGAAIFLVAAHSTGAVLGYVAVTFETASPTTKPDRRNYAYVAGLVVRESWQGRGIGTALLEAAEAEAGKRNISNLSIQVSATNAGAKRLYDRFGFQDFQIIMSKQLPASNLKT
ncbi:MAG: GNAT family N-acetyltransferase [Bosea sp. (in: a-proteobacteria)]